VEEADWDLGSEGRTLKAHRHPSLEKRAAAEDREDGGARWLPSAGPWRSRDSGRACPADSATSLTVPFWGGGS
jgi:hypothetical protein